QARTSGLLEPLRPDHQHHAGKGEQGSGDHRHEHEGSSQTFSSSGDVSVKRANDLQYSSELPLLPISLGTIRVVIVTTDAIRLHFSSRRVPQDVASLEAFKAVDGGVGVSPKLADRKPLEVLAGSAVLS